MWYDYIAERLPREVCVVLLVIDERTLGRVYAVGLYQNGRWQKLTWYGHRCTLVGTSICGAIITERSVRQVLFGALRNEHLMVQ